MINQVDEHVLPLLGVGERDESIFGLRWRELSKGFSFLGQKIVLCLPGDGATTAQKSNGMVKVVQLLFPQCIQNKVRFLGFYYSDVGLSALHRMQLLQETNQLKDRLDAVKEKFFMESPYYQDFFNMYLKPLVSTPSGDRISLAQAKANMRNLMMIGHCHGSAFAFQMERCFLETMTHLGYSAEEQSEIQQQLVIVAFASQIPVGISKSTLFHISSVADTQCWLNGRAENLHSFLASQPEETSKATLIPWGAHEAILQTKRICIPEPEEKKNPAKSMEHALSAFLGREEDVQKRTPAGKQAVPLIKNLVRQLLSLETECPTIKEILSRLPYQKFVQNALEQGKKQIIDFRKYQNNCFRGRTVLFKAIRNQNVEFLKGLFQIGVPSDLRDEKKLFPIHAAIKTNNFNVVDLICKNTPRWYSLMTGERETPIIYALLYKRFDIAIQLWNNIERYETDLEKSVGMSLESKRETHSVFYSFFEQVTQTELPIDKEDALLFLKTAEVLKERPDEASQKMASLLQKQLYSFLSELPPKLFFKPMYRQETTLAESLSQRTDDEFILNLIQSKQDELMKKKLSTTKNFKTLHRVSHDR